MNAYDRIQELTELKKSKINTPEEKEKYEILKRLLKEKDCFFQMNMETAFGIFDFLELDEEKAIRLYNELISFQNYEKEIPAERLNIKKNN